MLNYIEMFFIQRVRGVSYIPTIYLQTIAAIFLLNDLPHGRIGWLKKAAEGLISCAAVSLISVLYMALFKTDAEPMSHASLGLFTLLYACLVSRYPARVRLVRGTMFMACVLVSIPLSAPLGTFFASIDQAFYAWAQYLTLLLVVVMTVVEVVFLRHFSLEDGSFIQPAYVLLQVGTSLATIAIEGYAFFVTVPSSFNMLVCAVLWGVNMLTYYLFYSIGKGARENLALRTTQHRIELEQEKYEANRVNYDELRALRHELKNYTFYAKALLDAEKYDELADFLSETMGNRNPILNSYDCGNYIVDVILNHEMNVAREKGVTFIPDVLVPRELPFGVEDLCSLLSNLLDNAIEAAAASGCAEPAVRLTIRPKQAYLFIHQENSVSAAVPTDQLLSLKTTKKNRELHGFGTKIISRVVDKYSGSIKYAMKDGSFVTDVMLELLEEENA